MADKVAVLVAGEGAEREGEDRDAVGGVTLLVRGEELDFIFQRVHKFTFSTFEFVVACLFQVKIR